jgi:AraC-like DNA-binding protein
MAFLANATRSDSVASIRHSRGVDLWKCRYDPKTKSRVHVVAPGIGHAWLSPVVAYAFQVLRVSAALWDGDLWSPIHVEPDVIAFEIEHGMDPERSAYNVQKIAEAVRRGELVRGEHAGYEDLFQPIVVSGKTVAVLVTGPFARSRPTSRTIAERWQWLTGRTGHPSDPEFASYLDATLSTLVLEGKRAATFERLADCFARLMAGGESAGELTTQADALRAELEDARAVEQIWDVVRTMVDERTSRTWQSAYRAWRLRDLGLSRVPDDVLLGLTVSRARSPDRVDEAVRRDALQRRAVDLAQRFGSVLAGRVGDQGVVFLSASPGSAERRRQRLTDIADRASGVAKDRFDLALHFGACIGNGSVPLSTSYQAALGAAQSALTQGKRMIVTEGEGTRPTGSLRHLHEELARTLEERPDLLAPRFARYLEAVAMHCGYRIEAVQTHLEVGFERMADVLLKSGALDPKGFDAMRMALDRAAAKAATLRDLFEAHERAAADLVQATVQPVPARRERNLRGALDFIREHFAEPIDLKKVARVAGFNPTYFSELFAKHEGCPFEQYVRRLRVERAKQLLTSGELAVARVAELSGFRSPEYLCRVLRASTGLTPRAYRLAFPGGR